MAVRGDYAFVGMGPRLSVVDVSDPRHPREVGRTPPLTGLVHNLAADGGILCAATADGGLWTIDVVDPLDPRPLGNSPARSFILDVALADGFAYVAGAEAGLRVLDLSDPTAPTEVAVRNLGGLTERVALDRERLYVVDSGSGLWVFGREDPAQPRLAGHLLSEREFTQLAVSGDHVFVTEGWEEIVAIDVAEPAVPSVVGRFAMESWIYESGRTLALHGDYLYASCYTTIEIIDTADPTEMKQAGYVEYFEGVLASADHRLFVVGDEGMRILDIADPVAPALAGSVEGFSGGRWLAALSDRQAYVDAGSGRIGLLDLVTLEDPLITPLAQDSWPWGTIHDVMDGRAVVTVDSSGRPASLALLDITDPLRPKELARFTPRESMFVYMARLSGGHLFLCGTYGLGGSDLLVFDISDPQEPQFLGELTLEYIAGDMAVRENRAYFALTSSIGDADGGSPGTFLVVDISDPSEPRIVSRMLFPRSVRRILLNGARAYLLTGDDHVSDSSGLAVMRVYDTLDPSMRGFVPLDGLPLEMAIDDQSILISTADRYEQHAWSWQRPASGSVRVIDRDYWEEVGRLPFGSRAYSLNLVNNRLWVGADFTGLWAWRQHE